MKTLENKKEITKSLGFKVFLIFLLVWFLTIASSFIEDIIRERRSYQNDATSSIIEPIGGSFGLEIVAISLPYHYYVKVDDKRERRKRYALIMPNTYKVDAHAKTKILNRGIFKTPVYTADIDVFASFEAFDPPEVDYTVEYLFNEAALFLSTRNKQNFLAMPTMTIDGKELKESKRETPDLGTNINELFAYSFDGNLLKEGFDLNANLEVQGGGGIRISPLAGNSEITMTGDWADPSFTGNWVTSQSDVSSDGFAATWKVPGFNTSFDGNFYLDKRVGKFYSVNTSFLMLNDTYSKSMRSIKYSLLFICVPFFALFLCEMLTRRKVHMVQYALIGLANVVFYLLLLSISEHLNFNLSYIISAAMVVALTSLYVAALTKMKKLGIAIAVVEGIIYTFLFGILQLTDYALLVGSFGLFIAIAAAMYFTRNIDLYLDAIKDDESKENDTKDKGEEDKFTFK